ncbi:interferon omega-1-like [Pteropus medius]|uniref:interferon omega-1-like n=1 Tax=Pteropus vampyrus TaxID=132908 RepID=UPI00196A8697|nr:interferon omega-1-like [Pteropus giganteus]
MSMAQCSLWLGDRAMRSSILICSLGGDVPWIHSLENRKIVSLLRELEVIPSHFSLNDRTDFKFRWERGSITEIQKTQRTCFHHLVLQQIFSLLNAADSHAAWNRTLLYQLLSRLHHSLEELDQTNEGNLVCPYLGILVWNYFQGIHNYLKQKKYSTCAWEVVRVEIRKAFSLSTNLLDRL